MEVSHLACYKGPLETPKPSGTGFPKLIPNFSIVVIDCNDAHCLETRMADDSDSEGHAEGQNKTELLAYFQVK